MNGISAGALGNVLLPEILLTGFALISAVLGVLRPGRRPDLYRWIAVITLLAAVAACGFTLHAMRNIATGVAVVAWNGGLIVDHFSLYVTVTVCAFSLVTCLSSDTYLRRIPSRSAGFFSIVLLVTAAISALAAERDMVTFFVTLEVVIVGLTALHAMIKADDLGAEAAWKYMVEGAVASAMVLDGLALLYGITGSTSLNAVSHALTRAPATGTLGIVLVLLGLTFPLGVAPLRQWLPRVGDAAPATVAGFAIAMGTTAGAVAWLRFGVSGLGLSVGPWIGLTAVLAAIALVQATFSALREVRVTRLVGALASAQAALLLLAVISFGPGAADPNAQGATAFLFSLSIFGAGLLATFIVLGILQAARLPDTFGDYRGLGHRSPRAALLLAVALAALLGAPPMAGFLARFFVLESALDAGYAWVAALGVAAIAVVAIPAVRLIASMYADAGDDAPFTMEASPRLTRIVAGACCAAAFLATVIAQPLLMLARGGAGPIP
ncbi:MAG: NADH-quinone oxidoreductase subunit N [Candidatus Dormibacteria bacterium]